MKLKLLAIILASLLPLVSFGQTAASRSTFMEEVDTNLPSGTGALTAANLRLTIKDLAASSIMPLTDTYSDPSWLTGLSWSKIIATGTPTNGTFLRGDGQWAPISGSGIGDMLKATYDADNDGTVDLAEAVAWLNVTGRPTTFAPSAHSHTASEISDATTAGRALLTASDAAAQKTALALQNVANVDTSNAANITSGTLPAGRFGTANIPVAALSATGTASSSTYLRGDGLWSTPGTSGGGGEAVVTVAPASSSRSITTDQSTDGTADEVEINLAIAALARSVAAESIVTGGHVLVSNADSTTGWTANSSTMTLDTTTKKLGTGAIKIASTGSAIRPAATVTASSVNATSYDYLDFFAFVNDPGKILVTITTSDGSRQLETKPETIGGWSHVLLPLREAFTSTGTLGSVTSIKFQALGGEGTTYPPSSYAFWVDNVGFSTRSTLAHRQIHPGSVAITSRTVGTDYDINYDAGELTPIPGGGITTGSTISVDYTWGGGTVKLLSGQYNITATSIRMRPYVTLDMTDGAVLKQQTGTWAYGDAIIESNNTANQLRRSRIVGGQIVGYRDGLSQAVNVDGIQISNCYDFVIRDTNITNMSGAGIYFSRVSSSWQDFVTVTGVWVERSGSEWVDVTGGAYQTLAPSYAQHRGSIELSFCRHFDVSHVTVNNAMGDGTKITDSLQGRFSECRIRNVRMGGWFVNACSLVTGTGNEIEHSGSRGVTFDGNSNSCTFVGNVVTQSGREGVWISLSSNILVASNVISNAGMLVSSGGITGDMANWGIRISAPTSGTYTQVASNNVVLNNIVDVDANYCQTAAIRIGADAGATIAGNTVYGNTFPGTQKNISNGQADTRLFPASTEVRTANFDGGGTTVTTGARTVWVAPYAFTITGWNLVSPQTGSITVDIRKGSSPSSTSSITGGASPALSSANIASSTNLSSWTSTTFAAGDVVDYVITGSPSAIQNATLTLQISK